MLFFVDETWQNVGGRDVGALGAIAIPRAKYNAFCREVWNIKHNVLGATELDDCEIKGTDSFAKSAFRARDHHGQSNLLQAAEETFAAVAKYHGHAFALWTDREDWLLFRNPDPEDLASPYKDLLHDFRRCMWTQAKGAGRQGLLFFDHRGRKEDLSAACAVQNFLVRVGGDWRELFMHVPHFTPSAVSPGIQAADLVAHLAAHQNDRSVRPQLHPYWETVRELAYKHGEHKPQRALRKAKEHRSQKRK